MQSVKKDIRNVREADSITTLSNDQSSHKCGYQHQVYPNITIAYNDSKVFYKVKQCAAIPAALQWAELSDITLAVENGGSVTCVKLIKHDNSSYVVVGGETPEQHGIVWIISIKSGRLIRNCFTTPHSVTALSCYSNPSLLSDPGLVLVIGTLQCHLYITHVNPLTSPNSKQKHLSPTTYLDDISATTLGSSTHPCFEVGGKARDVKGIWNYMLPGMRSGGKFYGARVTSVELLDSMGCLIVGYSMGGWQIWSVAGSKAVLQFTSTLLDDVFPVTNFCLLIPENDPHNILYLWVTHSESSQGAGKDEGCLTTATMYQLRFRNKVVGTKPGVNDQYRRIESLIQSFHFNLSQSLFIGKESGVFQKLIDFEAIQKINYLQGCNDFNGVVMSLDTTKFIITVLFDLNAWYFAQMPSCPNQVARLSPYISYLPLEKTSAPSYCCLQAVKVKSQSLFRGKQSSSEACNVFPSSLNTIVSYHIGKNIINAFYFPANELVMDPGNSVQGLADLALKGIFTKHNTLVQSKKGRQKVIEFLAKFLPDLKVSLNEAMSPMLSGLPTADTEIKKLRELLCVTSHCIHLGNKLNKSVTADQQGHHILYKHTFHYAKTVLSLTDMGVLPASHNSLQYCGCRMLPLRYSAIGELLDNIVGLPDLWEDEMFPPKTIRSLLNIFYTKPLDITLQSYVVAYSVLYLNKEGMDIRRLNLLSSEDADAIHSLYYLDRRDYKQFIRYLPTKSNVFVYCNINAICNILLQYKKKDVAVQMLMVLDESYTSQYSPRTMCLLTDMLSSEYKINLISNGATDILAFSSVLDDQLTHKQFVSLMKSLDTQERFDCLFYLILKKSKLCDLLSAYGEAQQTQKSGSQFLEFMFLYTIKHFSDIELKASITASQGAKEDNSTFNKSVPLSAQRCQNDISVLSRFCLKTDLGNFKLGRSPKIKKGTSDPRVLRTPPPKSLDVSDELLQQLRTPHPTPLKEKVLTALQAPRSILRSSKTDRKNRKRIRFDDPADTVVTSNPTRLSFGGVEFNEPSSASSPSKKLTFDEDVTSLKGVSIADISPPKPLIESVVHYDDATGEDEQITPPQELSNDSISFEIFSSKFTKEPATSSGERQNAEFKFSPVASEPSVTSDFNTLFGNQGSENTSIDLSMDESFVSAASDKSSLISLNDSQTSQRQETAILVNSSDNEVKQPTRVCFADSSIEEIMTSPASPDISFDISADSETKVISLDSSMSSEERSVSVQDIESLDQSREEGEGNDEEEEEVVSEVEEVGEETDEEQEEEQGSEVRGEGEEQEDTDMAVEEEAAVAEDDAASVQSGGSIQVIGIDSSHSDVEGEYNSSSSSASASEDELAEAVPGSEKQDVAALRAAEAEQSDGSIQVIGINSHSEADSCSSSGSEDGSDDDQSDSSEESDDSEPGPDDTVKVNKEVRQTGDGSGSESSGPAVLAEESNPSSPVAVRQGKGPDHDVNSGTEADTESSDGDGAAAAVEEEDETEEEDGDESMDHEPAAIEPVVELEPCSDPESDDGDIVHVIRDLSTNALGEDEGIDNKAVEEAEEEDGDEWMDHEPAAIDLVVDPESDDGDVVHVIRELSTDALGEDEKVENETVEEAEEHRGSDDSDVVHVIPDVSEPAVDGLEEIEAHDIPETEAHDIPETEAHDIPETVRESPDLVMVLDSSDTPVESETPTDQDEESSIADQQSQEQAVDPTSPPQSTVPSESLIQELLATPSQDDESFVSATDMEVIEDPYAAGPSDVGQILESDESEDEEEFVFEAPQQLAPHNTWFMETFPDHDKLSFDFNVPQRAAPPTQRITRSRSKKLKALGSKDVPPRTVPIFKAPPPLFAPVFKAPSPPRETSSAVTLDTQSPTSEGTTISSIASPFSPEQPESKQPVAVKVLSPFTSSLAGLFPERSGPRYQLQKSGDGKFKLQDVTPAPTSETINLSGDTESLDGSEFHSFVTVDENLDTSDLDKSSVVVHQADSIEMVDIPSSQDSGELQSDDFVIVEHDESDGTESLPSSSPDDTETTETTEPDSSVINDTPAIETMDSNEAVLESAENATLQETEQIDNTSSVEIEVVPSLVNITSSEDTSWGADKTSESAEFIDVPEVFSLPSLSSENDKSEVSSEIQPESTRNLTSRDDSKEVNSNVSESEPVDNQPTSSTEEIKPRSLRSRKVQIAEEKDSSDNIPVSESGLSKVSDDAFEEAVSSKRKMRKVQSASEETTSSTSSKSASEETTSSTSSKRPYKILRAPRTLRSQKLMEDKPDPEPVSTRRNLRSRREPIPVQEESSTKVSPVNSSSSEKNSSESDHDEAVSSKQGSPVPDSPPATRRALRSRTTVTEDRPSKGKLRPRRQTNSESNSEEKPANKVRKSVSPSSPSEVHPAPVPVSAVKSKPPLPSNAEQDITVTRSTRRQFREHRTTSSTSVTSEPTVQAELSEATPVRATRRTRATRKIVGSTEEIAVREEFPARQTRRRKKPSEVSSSQQCTISEDSMPAKKSRPAPETTRRTRNTPARTPAVSQTERRETRSTRKASAK